jgi:acetyltransferase
LNKIGDLDCYPSVTDVGEEIDLALVALRAPLVLSAISDCAKANVRSAIIFSAGFKELGQVGEQHQEQLRKLADDAEIAIIGPNCLGAGNVNRQLNATFFPHPVLMKKGNVSLVSQSGGVAGLMIYASSDAGVGVAKFASVGNRVNIDFHDMLRYLSQDEETSVICLFIEGTEYGREMYEEIRVSKKPVIVYKVGKTPVARSAALSHTGSLAGKPELYTAAIQQAGGLEVSTVTEMIDTAKILSLLQTRPEGSRVAIVTHTLGPALIAAQILEEQGISLPQPSSESKKRIQNLLSMPVEIAISNPIDLLAQGWARPEIFSGAIELVLHEEQFDAVLTVFSPNYQEEIGGGMPIDDLLRVKAETGKPVVAILNSPECRHPMGREKLEENGVPVFAQPERAAKALANVLKRN